MVLMALLAGCGPKAPAVPPSDETYAIHVVVEPPGSQVPNAVGDELAARIAADLRNRGYHATPAPTDLPVATDAASRMGRLLAQPQGDVVALVEVVPRYSSLVAGRYDWDIAVAATLGTDGATVARDTFHVAAALRYEHQREADAVREAAPDVARKVAGLVATCGACRAARGTRGDAPTHP